MKTALVPILENKTGDTSDNYNYRLIPLVAATCSVFFKICSLKLPEMYLITQSHQFVFKRKHAFDRHVYICGKRIVSTI